MADQKSPTMIEQEVQAEPKARLAKRWGRVDMRGLEVLQVDIDNAMRENSHSCMIADAIKRQFPELKNVDVDMVSVRWTDAKRKRRVLCLTPMECQRALVSFDMGVKPKPFRFNLRSTQITGQTTFRRKVDENGKPVMVRRERIKRGYVPLVDDQGVALRDAKGRARYARPAVRDEAGAVVRETVSVAAGTAAHPSRKAELHHNGRGEAYSVHKVGGHMAPTHVPSSIRQRRFGVKGFTWDEGEDLEVVAARQRKSYGVPDDADA